MKPVGFRLRTIGMILSALSCSPLAVAAPWDNLSLFKRIDADPNKTYRLIQQNGPWLIMAMTFQGQDAREKARALVYELRKQYKLPAFTFAKKFDYSKPVIGRGLNRYGGPKRGRHMQHGQRLQIAVLVGSYPSVDDRIAQKDLKKVKTISPKSLTIERINRAGYGSRNIIPEEISSASFRETMLRNLVPKGGKPTNRGPMRSAFMVRNPLIPKEFFVHTGLEKFVVNMNKGVKYSLLNCPGKYTVQVATFKGAVQIGQRRDRTSKRKKTNTLADAAVKAHKMTLALRKKGYKAYEFHDRYSSIVTIGSFNSSGTPRADGKIEINPKMNAIINRFKATNSRIPAGLAGMTLGVQLKFTAKLPHDVQPWIVHVPRVYR